jgi:hypothetical protein
MILMRLAEALNGIAFAVGCSIWGVHSPSRRRSVLRVLPFYHAGGSRPKDYGRMVSGKARGSPYLSNDALNQFD